MDDQPGLDPAVLGCVQLPHAVVEVQLGPDLLQRVGLELAVGEVDAGEREAVLFHELSHELVLRPRGDNPDLSLLSSLSHAL
jgi:hypothetical protein